MKILLVAINSKYIHSNLAVHSLKAFALKNNAKARIDVAEYTINQPTAGILADIYKRKPDMLFVSCYIWNLKVVEELAGSLGAVRPELPVWLGGPEVSFDAENVMKRLPSVKGVICGEGEKAFCRIIEAWESGEESPADIDGIVYRTPAGITVTGEAEPLNPDLWAFAYEDMTDFKNRIVYYESSRGCPFRCSYCLSSVDRRLRFRSPGQVEKELAFFLKNKVPQVKFIDRTFNCSHEHAERIWRFIKKNDNGITNFHFEISGDLLNDRELELLAGLRPGQVQLEIGVQSTNEETLREINRPADFTGLSRTVKALKENNNVHLHLDLIAGLPFEDYESFRKSFNDVFSLRPHQLQLGFLKVLKGSPMAANVRKYGLKFTAVPPYEVLETGWISYEKLIKLKAVEEMVDVYYNSGQFSETLELLLKMFPSPFDFFDALAGRYEDEGKEMLNFSRNGRYEELYSFGTDCIHHCFGSPDGSRENEACADLRERLAMDYYKRDNVKNRPEFLGEDKVEKTYAGKFYEREAAEHKYLRGGVLDSKDPRVLRKATHLEKIGRGYYLFDYTRRSPIDNNATVIKL